MWLQTIVYVATQCLCLLPYVKQHLNAKTCTHNSTATLQICFGSQGLYYRACHAVTDADHLENVVVMLPTQISYETTVTRPCASRCKADMRYQCAKERLVLLSLFHAAIPGALLNTNTLCLLCIHLRTIHCMQIACQGARCRVTVN